MLKIQKASAGSGKTFSLTREYITLLLGQTLPDGSRRLYGADSYGFLKTKAHSKILAITFTNKATQEMTSRIIRELSLLANPTDDNQSDHLEYLRNYYNTTDEGIARAAQRALADLLFNFSWFNVSTIDSFFQNVLHTFARELDLPNSFSLEIDDNYPIAVAIGEMLSTINLPINSYDKATGERLLRLKSWLESYMRSLIDSGRNANLLSRSSKINRELTQTISRLRDETFKTHNKEITDYLSDTSRITVFIAGMDKSLQDLRDRLAKATNEFIQQIDTSVIPKTLYEKYLEPWSKNDFRYGLYDKNDKQRTTVPSAVEDESKRHKKLGKNQVWDSMTDQAMVSILRLGVTYYDNQRFYKILRRQIYLLGLFSEACTHIDEYCRENEAFLLGDTNSLLRKVICEVETPFVYERIGYTINNFLIDEFQDTSEMQWENLRPLVMESLARNNANLIIGDEKQCIYRFRNSNPELLGSEVEESTLRRFGDKDMIHVSGVKISENTNWRSSREVVMFNNTLFAYLSRLADSNKHSNYASKTYSALIQQVASKHSDFHGYVKMLFGPDSTAEQRWDEKSQLNYLGAEIDRQLSAGYKPKDIAILVRTHKQGQMVIAHLLEMMEADNWTHGHLKIVSSDALEISSSPAVQFIIGHLRLTTTPQYIADTDKPPVDGLPTMKPNPEYLRNRLIHRYELSVYDEVDATDADGNPVLDENGNQLKRRVSAEEALMKAIEETTPELKEKDAEALKQKFDQETTKTGDMDCPGIFSITEKIIQTLLPEQSREKECSFISAFQDLVLDFEERGESDVESFLNWWDSRGRFATLPAPEGQNAINVMTIHQSKGLEFKCVHLPFFNQQLVKFKGEGWYQLSPGYFPGVNPECIPPYIPLSHSSKFSNISALADQANLYEITQLIDGLNVAYVAFTRAVSELIVYSNPDTGRGENFGTYLLDAASNCNESALQAINLTEEQAQWVMPLQPFFRTLDNGESELIIGEPTVNVPTADKAKQTTGRSTKPLYPLSSPNAADCGLPESFDAEIPYNDVLEEYRIEQPADMVLPQDLEQQGVFDINNERHVGNFLHGALSSVRHLRDLPLAVERAAYRLNIPKYQWRPYLDMLSRSLQDERIKPWFEAYEQLMAERPLTAEDGLRRPDRVVVMPGGEVVVIDYKFGKPARKYEHQVREYMDLLADCGYTNIHGYLFFPMTSALFEVR